MPMIADSLTLPCGAVLPYIGIAPFKALLSIQNAGKAWRKARQ